MAKFKPGKNSKMYTYIVWLFLSFTQTLSIYCWLHFSFNIYNSLFYMSTHIKIILCHCTTFLHEMDCDKLLLLYFPLMLFYKLMLDAWIAWQPWFSKSYKDTFHWTALLKNQNVFFLPSFSLLWENHSQHGIVLSVKPMVVEYSVYVSLYI